MKAVCRPSGILFEVVTEEGGLLAVASTVRTAVANALDVWRRVAIPNGAVRRPVHPLVIRIFGVDYGSTIAIEPQTTRHIP